MSEEGKRAGKWCALIAGSSGGSRNQTGLGAVVYDDEGNLAGFKWAGLERAIERGDLSESIGDYEPSVPATVEEMEKRLGSFSNAMSVVRWEGLLVTLVWDEATLQNLYETVTEIEESP